MKKKSKAFQTIMIRHLIKGKLVRTYKTRRSKLILGSSRAAHIRLFSRDIAGVVAILEFQHDGWCIVDLGSQPDLKFSGKPFVEEKIQTKGTLIVGDHTLEIKVAQKSREMFTHELEVKGASQTLTVIKWRGRIVETVSGSVTGLDKVSSQVEVLRLRVPQSPQLEREKITIEPEMRKPLKHTLATALVFFLVLIGLPLTKREEPPAKPKDNVYTRMIFDGKILDKKRKQLASHGVKTSTGTGNGNGSISEGAKGTKSSTQKAVASLRKSGLQSIITQIAGRASKSAKMFASLATTPSANAAIEPNQIGSISAIPSSGAAQGKAGIAGNNKGFKIGGIGTSGKGGGSGQYKNGSGLGTGSVGNGEVGIEDTETVVEGGLDKEVIAGVIREHLGQIRYCYERQLSANPDLYGKIKVKFSIGADGLVFTQEVGQSTLKSAMVEECILRRIATWKFPKPKGGTRVLVSYPFLFKSVN